MIETAERTRGYYCYVQVSQRQQEGITLPTLWHPRRSTDDVPGREKASKSLYCRRSRLEHAFQDEHWFRLKATEKCLGPVEESQGGWCNVGYDVGSAGCLPSPTSKFYMPVRRVTCNQPGTAGRSQLRCRAHSLGKIFNKK